MIKMSVIFAAAAFLCGMNAWSAQPDPISAPNVRAKGKAGTNNSLNWSGYAVTGAVGSVTNVKGSWIVPAISTPCPVGSYQYSSFWVGIDGYNSSTVEQAGTDSDCANGVPQYYTWYEFYPKRSRVSALAVKPGDSIQGEVSYIGGGNFLVTLTNVTTGQSFSVKGKVANAKRSSAEWIAEAPSSGGILPLANFGTSYFGMNFTSIAGTCAATLGGQTGPIGQFGAGVQQITMVTSSGTVKAQPSNLSTDGTSFQDQWYSSGP